MVRRKPTPWRDTRELEAYYLGLRRAQRDADMETARTAKKMGSGPHLVGCYVKLARQAHRSAMESLIELRRTEVRP